MHASRSTLPRRTAAALVGLAVVLLLAGCFFDAPPPKGSEAALTSLLSRIEHLPGVATASGEVRQRDAKDAPKDWLADIRITAGGSGLDTAREVREAAAKGVTGTRLLVTLDVPGAPGLAEVTVDPMEAGLVALVDRLRRESVVASVSGDAYGSTVGLAAQASIAGAVTSIRPLLEGRSATLERGRSSVGVTATYPGPSLLGALDGLDSDAAVSEIDYTAGTSYAAEPGGSAERPRLSVEARGAGVPATPASTPAAGQASTSAVTALAAALARTTDEAADAHVAPRTAFSVGAGDDTDASGWLGLPLGSAQPDDDAPVVKTPGPLPTDGSAPAYETWVPADVAAQTAALTDFLTRSAAATTVGSAVTTGVEQCSPTDKSDLSGTRATAWTVVPIFTVYDDGQKPFDAVAALWSTAGMRLTDHAMGQDHWAASAKAAAGGVASADMEGTVDGLSMRAQSGCVG
ncbi:hypothetical protein [Frondihabitans cladoniiphilus]|uniref:Uncharacterized protein n=1 Tax=Frondihabitans cladoniiphilus TaxID=715785 RepID=A0ABP8W076_9MICO